MKEETPLHVAMRSSCSGRKEECLHQLLALGSLVDEKDKDVGTLSYFFWPLYYFSYFDLQFLITPLVSSTFSQPLCHKNLP
jgi:hypothetical protein